METSLFDYDLPKERIAQTPAEPRDSSRLLVLERATGHVTHTRFNRIGEWLRAGDLLVGNDSRVIPARLHGHKASGGAVEVLLLRRQDEEGALWRTLVRGKVRAGTRLLFGVEGLSASVVEVYDDGTRMLRFSAPVRPYLDDSVTYVAWYALRNETDRPVRANLFVYADPEGKAHDRDSREARRLEQLSNRVAESSGHDDLSARRRPIGARPC